MGKAKEYNPKHLLAYCECGFKLMETTKEDIWNGVQPQCVRCIKRKNKKDASKGQSRRSNRVHRLQKTET